MSQGPDRDTPKGGEELLVLHPRNGERVGKPPDFRITDKLENRRGQKSLEDPRRTRVRENYPDPQRNFVCKSVLTFIPSSLPILVTNSSYRYLESGARGAQRFSHERDRFHGWRL